MVEVFPASIVEGENGLRVTVGVKVNPLTKLISFLLVLAPRQVISSGEKELSYMNHISPLTCESCFMSLNVSL